jgi:hypothetical protein
MKIQLFTFIVVSVFVVVTAEIVTTIVIIVASAQT